MTTNPEKTHLNRDYITKITSYSLVSQPHRMAIWHEADRFPRCPLLPPILLYITVGGNNPFILGYDAGIYGFSFRALSKSTLDAADAIANTNNTSAASR